MDQQDQIGVSSACRCSCRKMFSATAVVAVSVCVCDAERIFACFVFYLMLALHPTHSDIVLVGLPGPFLKCINKANVAVVVARV